MGIVIHQSIKGSIANYTEFIGYLSIFSIITRFFFPEEIGLTRIIEEVSTVAILGTSSSAMCPPPPVFQESGIQRQWFLFSI
jgi:hypothetical protein